MYEPSRSCFHIPWLNGGGCPAGSHRGIPGKAPGAWLPLVVFADMTLALLAAIGEARQGSVERLKWLVSRVTRKMQNCQKAVGEESNSV